MNSRAATPLVFALAAFMTPPAAHAAEPFTFLTGWFAQAEHGGFYQALAEGTYEKNGLDVTIKMGGPQMNVTQLMVAGQADCIMSSDTQAMQTRAGGVPVTVVAAYFQKDPDVLIVHEDVKSPEDLKTKTILISASANRSYWPWLKAKYGFTDSHTRAYTYNSQPFLADENTAQQGFLTSDPADGRETWRQVQHPAAQRLRLSSLQQHRVLPGTHGEHARQADRRLPQGHSRGLEELPGQSWTR